MKVKLENLRVESFATTAAGGDARGTVNANEASALYTCRFSCPPYYTCPECAPRVVPERPAED